MSWWESDQRHWQRTGVIVAGIALLATILGLAATGGGESDGTAGGSSPSNATDATPTAFPSATPTSEATGWTSDQLVVTAGIDESDRAGKDKAFACEAGEWFCLELVPTVISPAGEIEYGCNLYWELYREDPAGRELINKGYSQDTRPCAQDGSVDVVVPDLKTVAMPPGLYVLEMSVELDDGVTADGSYSFTLVDRAG